jgi:hypothetical protein
VEEGVSLEGGGEPEDPVGGVAGEAEGDGAPEEAADDEEEEDPPDLFGMKMAAEDMAGGEEGE